MQGFRITQCAVRKRKAGVPFAPSTLSRRFDISNSLIGHRILRIGHARCMRVLPRTLRQEEQAPENEYSDYP